jgi:hypothetical protein
VLPKKQRPSELTFMIKACFSFLFEEQAYLLPEIFWKEVKSSLSTERRLIENPIYLGAWSKGEHV